RAATARFSKALAVSKDDLTFTEVFHSILDEGSNQAATPLPLPALHTFTRLDLELGLQRGQFEMYYQPKIRASSRKLEGAEALIRWKHPQFGVLAPDQFLPTAEST